MRRAAVAWFSLALTVAGCADFGGPDAPPLRQSRPAKHPRAGASAQPRAAAAPQTVWSYVLPVDHGVRRDRAGTGLFRAARKHGQHNGVDLLAPVGTPVLSACEGEARGGESRSFGTWVQLLCEVPTEVTGNRPVFASLFYAHLNKRDVSAGSWTKVSKGEPLGAVGKTGNSRDPSVQPHLHLEMIAHGSARAVRAETHAGADQSDNKSARYLSRRLDSMCLKPTGLSSHADVRRARRMDPFLTLTCVGVNKPPLQKPASPLDSAMMSWSRQYSADTFDVDVGLRSRP